MACAKSVVFAFRTLGERRQALLLLYGRDFAGAAAKNFMWVGLMAHIPDYPVTGRIIKVVQRDGQLDTAQAGSEMPAAGSDRLDQEAT